MLKRNGQVASRDDQLSLFDFARRGGSKEIYLTLSKQLIAESVKLRGSHAPLRSRWLRAKPAALGSVFCGF